MAVITLHPTVGTITLDVTVVGITKDVVELKGTSTIEQDGTVAGVTAGGIFAASCCLFLRWYVDHQFFIWIDCAFSWAMFQRISSLQPQQ